MKNWKIGAAVAVAFGAGTFVNSPASSAALGFCYEPSAPSVYLRKPDKPYCAASRSCSTWEVNGYKSEIDSYFRKLRSYAQEVDSYYSEATEYVACMSKLD